MEETKMKWSKRTLVYALLFGLVTTSLLAWTLARYVTTGAGADTARVAKWGVIIDAETPTGGLFSTNYTKDNLGGALTVQSGTSAKVVAPGTSGKISGFSISGVPEVACDIGVTVNNATSELTGWTVAGSTPYEPIKWTLKKGATTIVNKGTFDQLKGALDDISIVCAPSTDLSAIENLDYEISWEWPYIIDGTHDTNDTFLGNKATAPTVTLDFSINITQTNEL